MVIEQMRICRNTTDSQTKFTCGTRRITMLKRAFAYPHRLRLSPFSSPLFTEFQSQRDFPSFFRNSPPGNNDFSTQWKFRDLSPDSCKSTLLYINAHHRNISSMSTSLESSNKGGFLYRLTIISYRVKYG